MQESKTTDLERWSEFNQILSKRGPGAFQEFIAAVPDSQKHILDKVSKAWCGI